MTQAKRPEIGATVVANGIKTNYLEDGTGSPVVFIHGSGPGVTAYANWRLVMPRLAPRFRTLAPDLAGFGYTDRRAGTTYNIQVWADQVIGFLDALDIPSASLVGNSFGGAIALRVVTQHPDRVDKLVLMGSMGVPFPITEGLDRVWGYQPSVENMRQLLGIFAYSPELANDEQLARVRYEASTQPGFQEAFSSMFPPPRQNSVDAMIIPDDELRNIGKQTLIVHGRDDKVIPLENSLRLLQLINRSQLHVFGRCGHWTQIERAGDFTRLVDDFLSRSGEQTGTVTTLLTRSIAWRNAGRNGAMSPTQKRARRGSSRPRSTASAPERQQIDKDLYIKMFRTMALMRAVEDRMVSMYRQGEMLGSVYTGHWHEAIAVGTAAALRPGDFLAPLHRDLGAHLWRGTEPRQVMASFLGKATGPTGGRDGTLHYGRLDLNIYNPPSHIPDNYPVATGAAFAFKYRGQDGVALAYCGDGSTSRGDFHEALNNAAVMKLPCIFVIENNQYSYSTPLKLTTASADLASKAAAYGMPGERVDGINVLAVHDATSRAVARARAGGGPSVIEAVTMRMHGHAEHDPADYVPSEMLAQWAKRDPVEEFAATLLGLGLLGEEGVKAIKEEAHQAALDARKQALADPLPDPSTVEEGVYAD